MPDTVADRGIPLRMQRRTAAEPITRLRPRVLVAETRPVREALATWAATAVPVLREAEPAVPDVLTDRSTGTAVAAHVASASRTGRVSATSTRGRRRRNQLGDTAGA